MQCTKCGQELPAGAAFCPYCGESVAAGGQGMDQPIYLAEVKGLLKSGKLAVYRDRVEFSTSIVQKAVYDYASLVAVKKRLLPTPAILFITQDARTEACAATSKNIHEAFLYVEQAVKPYLEARKARLQEQGIRYSFISSMGVANSGLLNISDDKAEFLARSGNKETVSFRDVRSVSLSAGLLEFLLFCGEIRSFSVDKESRDEVLAFVSEAIAPYLAQRKKELLAKGIYHSCLSSWAQEGGTLDIYEDRAEFTSRSGRTVAAAFRDVRTAALSSEMLELRMVDGSVKEFVVDKDEKDAILAFVSEAVAPYQMKRTEGFDTAFGSPEKIEINPGRGVFHLIRQDGAVITDECPLENIIRCQWEEPTGLNPMISGIRMGSKAIANKAAEMAGRQGTAQDEEKIRSIDILLTIKTGEQQQVEALRFGDFPLGISRTSPKYAQCAAEAAGLMDYLSRCCPACERILPAPEPAAEEAPAEGLSIAPQEAELPKAEIAPIEEPDPLGIRKHIKRMSEYIGMCNPPMSIAFQGNAGSGEGMRLLADILKEQYKDNLIWLHGKQLSRSEAGGKLPMYIGAALVGQLGGTGDGRVVKLAKASLNLAITLISQGNSDGQPLIDALFKDSPSNPQEGMLQAFSELVKKKIRRDRDKVIVLVDDLDGLAPAKAVEILEAMEDFLHCEDCVFIVSVDYADVIRGFEERYGQDKSRGDAFFNKIFRTSFRLPASPRQTEGSIKSKLEQIGLTVEDPSEIELYRKLLERSVGSGPDGIGHLFDSFHLLKTLADADMYASKHKRLILFGLLCMQSRFPEVYGQLVKMRDSVTPQLLSGLCGAESDVVLRSGLAEDGQADFRRFAQVFCGIINADGAEGISESGSGIFSQVLEFTGITSM